MRTYVKTYSVCVGNRACNAACPFCVARMTGTAGTKYGPPPPIDSMRLRKGAELAKMLGATTALLTGKGEPLMWPERLYETLDVVSEVFPLVEVQTNGIRLSGEVVDRLYGYGVTMVALSCVHYDTEANEDCYGRNYPLTGLEGMIHLVHGKGISVRLTCMLCKGWIDSVEKVEDLIQWAAEHRVEQLTVRPIVKPEKSNDAATTHWVAEHELSQEQMHEIEWHIHERSTRLNTLVHGHVYAYPLGDGSEQNVCVSDCLTRDASSNEIRQFIYCPDGHIRYDWVHDAAIVF